MEYCERLAQVFLLKPDIPALPVLWRKEVEAILPNVKGQTQNQESLASKSNIEQLTSGLLTRPQLQARLAEFTSYTPSKWLLEKELALRQSNESIEAPFKNQDTEPISPATQRKGSWSPEIDVYEAAARESLTGLSFSGGGIRSATFNLGILQGLAARGLLSHFDYLSSVSGGGYIHQWLAAWILRSQNGLQDVQQKLISRPIAGSSPQTPRQISWLRRYASYLTPQRGFFSADTWTMISIWFRNTLLNQIVLFSFLGIVLFAFHAFLPGLSTESIKTATVQGMVSHHGWSLHTYKLMLCVICALCALKLGTEITVNFWRQRSLKYRELLLNNTKVVGDLVFPGLLLALAVTFLLATGVGTGCISIAAGIFFALLNLVVTFSGGLCEPVTRGKNWILAGVFVLSAFGTAAISALLLYFVAAFIFNPMRLPPLLASVVAPFPFQLVTVPPLLYAAPFLAVNLQIGILGRCYLESRREWIARLRAWTVIVGIAWFLLSGISLLGPSLIHWLTRYGFRAKAWSAVMVFLASHGAALYSGASRKTDGTPSDKGIFGYKPLDLLGIVAAPCAILSLLIFISFLLQELITHPLIVSAYGIRGQLPAWWFLIAMMLLLIIYGWRVDVNEFSMHGFYRNRLSRCYLGASLEGRAPDPFIGFDERAEVLIGSENKCTDAQATEIHLPDLLPERFQQVVCGCEGKAQPIYTGPFPIFCCTLNLTFGQDLAYQERKGASFAFTPLLSGYHVGWTAASHFDPKQSFNGFVPTAEYAYTRGVYLPTAAAISGAAMSPNQGFSTKATLAFLMTLFNVRLGWWIANPRRPKVWPQEAHRPAPRFPIFNLIKELLGAADDANDFVYLNDGGKFDNMGLYELVRRRCRFIVICDAEQDGDLTFEGIAMAIQKCRIDFGTEITLDLSRLKRLPKSKISAAHFAVGTVKYPAPMNASPGADERYCGVVVYIKSSLTGDEPIDIMSYAKKHDAFPHDMTTNQWFTESQFESYRRLGEHIVSGVFPDQPAPVYRSQVEDIFLKLYKTAKAGPGCPESA